MAQEFQNALDEVNRVLPEGIGFTEMFRTTEYQRTLYNNRGANPNPVAQPGTSRHESGFAFDVGQTLVPIFDRHGFTWGGHSINDPVHFEADPTLHGYASRADAISAAQTDYDNCARRR